jgi:hypothetical protein
MAMEDPNRKRTKHKMRLIEKTITENVGQSKLWYREKLESLPTRGRTMILENGEDLKRWPEKGKMYLFLYMPESRKNLQYYDLAPLIIPTDKQRNRINFRALNVHYLFPRFRYELINRLLNEGTSDLRITRTLNKFLRYVDGEDAGTIMKTYIYNKCRSRFLEIPPEEWELACALPMENFRKEHKTKVWSDTREELQ